MSIYLDDMYTSPSEELEEALRIETPKSENNGGGTSCLIMMLLLIIAIVFSMIL